MAKKTSIWKGEALKVQRKTLTAINGRMARGNVSTIGRLSMDYRNCARNMAAAYAAAYAEAMGRGVDRAAATIKAHAKHLAAFNARKA